VPVLDRRSQSPSQSVFSVNMYPTRWTREAVRASSQPSHGKGDQRQDEHGSLNTVSLSPSSEPVLVSLSILLYLRLYSKSRRSPSLASKSRVNTVRLCQLPILMSGVIVLLLSPIPLFPLTTWSESRSSSCHKLPTFDARRASSRVSSS
jgi:hypothetical protein